MTAREQPPVAITAADLIVDRSTADWGGPVATVTFPASLITAWASDGDTRTFRLRSTEGHDRVDADKYSILIDEPGPDGRAGRLLGAFRTVDMDEALRQLVEHLNDLHRRFLVDDATSTAVGDLSDAIRGFTEALEEQSWRDFRTEWANVRAAFHAAELAYAEVTR
jgi:hypothetical protein